jgi:tight adherence protein B
MSPDLIAILIFLGFAGTLGVGALAFAGDGSSKRLSKRLEAVRERHSTSREVVAKAQMKRIVTQREDGFEAALKQFIPRRAELRARLERTGRDWTLGKYVGVCGGVAAAALLVLLLSGAPLLLALLLGLFVGFGVPHFVVAFLIKRRLTQFTTRFPDAIDLLVRGLRSGLPVTESIGVVGREVPDPVGVEFRTIADKIRIGQTMDLALQEAATRLKTAEFQFFVITLSIQRETGGNLAETLSNLSEVLRKRAQMKLKIKAMSSEAKASAYIVGALPFIVFGLVYMINPTYLGGFFSDPRLMMTGGGGLLWMGIGALVMAKMVSFEI